ncbi:MAG: TIGR04283 family arsenosugar biosynthesis glycosyltransferase [Gemmataceae bacterium]
MTVSAIIPVFNEEDCLSGSLAALRALDPLEIIVVDGGSSDATCQAAASATRVLHGPRGRAAQLNLGASHARGDVLLFLHADCWLQAGALKEVETQLACPDVIAGCFSMCVPESGPWFRCIETCANVRVRLTGLAYGDQGLFLRRGDFERLGGFPPVQLLEDVLFSRVLRRHGRIVVARQCIHVSPRRWRKHGVVRQSVRNWALLTLAAIGVPPDRLAALYPPVR